jgi:GTP-binding protein HflX
LQIALAEIPYIRHKFENTELFKNVERKIKKELELKLKTRALMNTNRLSKNIPTVSVFGYTNVGKTSFIKEITNDAKMNPENKLFATLDVTYHDTTILNSAQKIIFTDTIGFISDIPFTLIESFKASISDALNADLYIHLVDMSHPDRLVQEQTVNKILKELAPEKKLKSMLTVYNKYDQAEPLEKTKEEVDNSVFFISCKTLFGFDHLRREIEARILKLLDYIELNLKVEQGGQELAFLYKNSIIKEIKQLENVQQSQFCVANVYMNKENALKLIHLFPNIKICK